MKFNFPVAAVVTLLATSVISMPAAQAQSRFQINTQSGAVSGGTVQGTNGSAGCIRGVRYGQSGGRACGIHGENGYTYGSSGVSSGTGAYRRHKSTYTNPTTGNSVSGTYNRNYNAQSGEGSKSVNRDANINGTSYGYDTSRDSSYTQGSGVSTTKTVNTQNNGSYTCSYTTGNGRVCVP